MGINIATRKAWLQNRHRQLAALGMAKTPRPVDPLTGRMLPFASIEEEQAHIDYVEKMFKSGQIPF